MTPKLFFCVKKKRGGRKRAVNIASSDLPLVDSSFFGLDERYLDETDHHISTKWTF